MDKSIYIQLMRNRPIHAHGLTFYPPSLSDIFDRIGYENLKNLMVPFCLTMDCFDFPDDTATSLSLFKDILLMNPMYQSCIRTALEIICHETQVEFTYEDIRIQPSENNLRQAPAMGGLPSACGPIIINEDDFEHLSQIMMALSGTRKIHIEKPPAGLSDRQLDIWKKLHEGRERERIKNTPALIDILNICSYGGDYYISMEEIERWNLWQLMNCYSVRAGLKDYNDCLALTPVTFDVKAISGDKHWTSRLKVRD